MNERMVGAARTWMRRRVATLDAERFALAWTAAQLGTGVAVGVLTAALVLVGHMSFFAALGTGMVAGLPLLAFLAVSTYGLLDRVGGLRALVTRVREPLIGLGALLGFGVTVPAVLVVTTVALGLVLVSGWALDGALAGDPETVVAALRDRVSALGATGLPTSLVATASAVLFGSGTVLAVGWAWLAHRVRTGRWSGLARVLGLKTTARVQMLAAAVGGLSMGWFPSLVADAIASSEPYLRAAQAVAPGAGAQSLDVLNATLSSAGLWAWMMTLVVVVIGPVAEELVFRGFLWDALRRWMPAWAVIGLTSVAFALAHVDPVHTPAVLLIGLFLGWLRWTSRSLVPCIVAHVLNNALGASLAAAGTAGVGVPEATAWSLGVMTVVVGALAAVAMASMSRTTVARLVVQPA